MYNKLRGYLCRDGLESFGFGLSYLHLGNRSCLVCVLLLDLPSLHVSHNFLNEMFLYLFVFFCVMFGMYIYYICWIENDISGMECIP